MTRIPRGFGMPATPDRRTLRSRQVNSGVRRYQSTLPASPYPPVPLASPTSTGRLPEPPSTFDASVVAVAAIHAYILGDFTWRARQSVCIRRWGEGRRGEHAEPLEPACGVLREALVVVRLERTTSGGTALLLT